MSFSFGSFPIKDKIIVVTGGGAGTQQDASKLPIANGSQELVSLLPSWRSNKEQKSLSQTYTCMLMLQSLESIFNSGNSVPDMRCDEMGPTPELDCRV